ncbi:MAG: hypothetical protein AB1521_12375 [Bacteroidota bacterium]
MGLQTSGIIFIIFAFGIIIGLTVFSFYKIFAIKKEDEKSRS